jgi:hypothetical protein
MFFGEMSRLGSLFRCARKIRWSGFTCKSVARLEMELNEGRPLEHETAGQ